MANITIVLIIKKLEVSWQVGMFSVWFCTSRVVLHKPKALVVHVYVQLLYHAQQALTPLQKEMVLFMAWNVGMCNYSHYFETAGCRNLHQAFVPGKLMQALVADVGEDIEAAPLNEGPELASDEFSLAEEAE